LNVEISEKRVVDQGNTEIDSVSTSDVILIELVATTSGSEIDDRLDVVLWEE